MAISDLGAALQSGVANRVSLNAANRTPDHCQRASGTLTRGTTTAFDALGRVQ